MKVKDFKNLKVGDRVVITTKKYGDQWNDFGQMDKWLGKTMTVREIVDGRRVKMEEDINEFNGIWGKGWVWHPEMIAEKIEPVREVKRHAKPGEYVKIVEPCYTLGCYDKGDILKVSDDRTWLFTRDAVKCIVPNRYGLYTVLDKEYVVLENYVPEEKVEEKKPELATYAKSCIDSFREVCSRAWKDENPTIVEHLVKGRKTIVKLSNGKVGVAVCSPEDKFDIYEGLRLATERAYGKAEPYKKPEAVKEVKRKAKVGEYIKIVNESIFTGGAYKNGDILKVYKIDRVGVYCEMSKKVKHLVNDNGNIIITHSEYVVLENYKPEPDVKEVKRRAKVGEYVKIVEPEMTGGLYKKGDILKVIDDFCPAWLISQSVKCEVSGKCDVATIYDREYVVLENYKPKK